MKSKLPILLCTFFIVSIANACPIWRIGTIKVVDENGAWIKDAYLVKYYDGGNDSIERVIDSSGCKIYSEGFDWDSEPELPVEFKYRIRANGYADWKIKEIKFHRGADYKSLPVLEVVMYHHRYLLMGNVFTKIKEFASNEIEFKKVNFYSLKLESALESAQVTTYTETSAQQSSFKINTYPNPVQDQLSIEVKDSIVLPYKAILCDLSGRVIVEQELTQKKTNINLQFEASGFYLISVYKHDGELLYSTKFIKQ